MKKFFSILIAAAISLCLFGCGTNLNSTFSHSTSEATLSKFETKLLKEAKKKSRDFIRCDNPYSSPDSYPNVGCYNGVQYFFKSSELSLEFYSSNTSVEDFDLSKCNEVVPNYQLTNTVQESQSLVSSYVKSSGVLTNPDGIIDKLSRIKIKIIRIDNSNIGAYYTHSNGILYISYYNYNKFEIVREYIHAISAITHENTTDTSRSSRFHRAMTDIIALSIVGFRTDITNYYDNNSSYFNYVYPYIYCSQSDGLKAFYYGDTFLTVPQDEFNFFVEALDVIDSNSDFELILNNLIWYWVAELNNKKNAKN